MSKLSVGFAQVDFTPEVGLPLKGNYRTDYASRGTHDPLCSHALVFAGAGGRVALLSCDVCMLDRENVALMREAIVSQCDIPAENIVITATHTHAGPVTVASSRLRDIPSRSIEAFLKKAATAVVEADRNLHDATLHVGASKEDRISFNRRIKCSDGKVRPNWECVSADFAVGPVGPIDPNVLTLAVKAGGKYEAAIVNFALHPAVLAGDNCLYSADYPGYLTEGMRRIFGEGFMTAFFNGCCGNVNHIDYSDALQGRGYMMTQRIGYMLAAAATEAIHSQTAVRGGQVAVSSEKVTLPRIKISQEQRQWAEDVVEKAKGKPASTQVDGLPDEEYAKHWLGMHEIEDQDYDVEVMAVRIGDLGIAALPGEVFCEFGMQIKQQSPAKHTMVFELANDGINYVATREAFGQGGYESSIGASIFEKGSGDKITASALSQLNKLFAKGQ